MTKQQMEVIPILRRELLKNKWICVFNPYSGVFFRDGYLFVYSVTDNFDKAFGCMHKIHSVYLDKGINKNSEWFIEKDGAIVEQGVITRRLADAGEIGESDSKYSAWMAEIEKINNVKNTNTPPKKLRMTKQKVSGMHFVDSDKSISHTHMFKSIKDLGTLKSDKYFVITGVVNAKFIVCEVDKNTLMEVGSHTEIEPDTIKKLQAAGVIVPVSVKEGIHEIDEMALVSIGVANVPKAFNKYNVKQKELLGYGLEKCVNVTPLLTGNEVSRVFVDALEASAINSIRELCDLSTTTECATLLAPLVLNGINLTRFKGSDVDVLKYRIEQSYTGWQEQIANNHVSSRYVEPAQALYSFGNESGNVLVETIKMRLNQLPCIKNAFLRCGVESQFGAMVNFMEITPEERKELFAHYSFQGLQLADGRNWSEYMTKVIGSANAIMYHFTYGLLIGSLGNWYGRDDNSVVVFTNDEMKPVWRAIKVNEEIIKYGAIDL